MVLLVGGRTTGELVVVLVGGGEDGTSTEDALALCRALGGDGTTSELVVGLVGGGGVGALRLVCRNDTRVDVVVGLRRRDGKTAEFVLLLGGGRGNWRTTVELIVLLFGGGGEGTTTRRLLVRLIGGRGGGEQE